MKIDVYFTNSILGDSNLEFIKSIYSYEEINPTRNEIIENEGYAGSYYRATLLKEISGISIDYGSYSKFILFKFESQEQAVFYFSHSTKNNEKPDGYLNWNDFFMELACLTSRRSKDPKTRVGCAIIDPETNNVISLGYNGLPVGKNFSDNLFDWKEEIEEKNNCVIHAEVNALLNASVSLKGKTLYTTMFPCPDCTKLLIQAGIKRIVYKDEKFRLKPEGQKSYELFKRAEIEIEKYKKGEN